MISKVKRIMDSRKLRQWQKELQQLSDETGITLEDVCRYLGVTYTRDIGFYVKLPMKRRTIIGIGMAYKLPLERINRWITYYGMKRRLYSKDICEDMIWIYLIRRNANDPDREINYFALYDECRQAAFETYITLWDEITFGSIDTSDVDRRLEEITVSPEAGDIKDFVINNLDSFKTAYSKPRRLLAQYLECIRKTNVVAGSKGKSDSLISLRGWLDDSMINYLAGDPETIHVKDRITGKRVSDFKKIPKSRKAHIATALALGMTRGEIDQYLELMGYMPLDEEIPNEDILIKALDKWDDEHPLQRLFKEKYINGDDSIELEPEEENQAASDMLMLRQELRDEYRRRKLKFEYMKS